MAILVAGERLPEIGLLRSQYAEDGADEELTRDELEKLLARG